jgi:hypothetical protein
MISDAYAETVASFVVDNGLAVVFSHRIDGDDPEAGKKGRSGWNTASPWPRGNRQGLVAQLKSYDGTRNLLVVTRESNVITIDCDTEAGLDYYRSLGLPNTVTISTGRDGGGFHFILRPPRENLDYSFFELAGEDVPRVTGAARTKLHVLAGVHKTGRRYKLMLEAGLEIAPMPANVYTHLTEAYGVNTHRVRADIPMGKRVEPSGRHDYLVGRASDYLYLGHRGEALKAHLRVDWDFGCVPEPGRDIDSEIAGIVRYAETRWAGNG